MHPLLTNRLDIDPQSPDALRAVPARSGVYLLTSEKEQPILLSFAENIRRVALNRITAPEEGVKSRRADLSVVARRIHWVETFSPFETTWIHWQAARDLYPGTYRELIAFPSAWFLRIDARAAHPRFTATTDLRADGATYFGPLAAERDAVGWIQMLEDAFDLCRYHDVLEQSPSGQRCAYFDMGKCPAPCDGSIPMDHYRAMIEAAIAFMRGNPERRLSELRTAMQSAAAALEFEKAAGVCRTIDRSESLIRCPEYEFMQPMDECRWLVIQRAGRARRDPKKSMLRPYYLVDRAIVAGEPAALSELDEKLPAWIGAMKGAPSMPSGERRDERVLAESVSLVARYLFQRDKAPGLFFRANELSDRSAACERIRARFTLELQERQAEFKGDDPN